MLGCDPYGGCLLPGSERVPGLILHASELHFVHAVSEKWFDTRNLCPF